MSRRGRSNRFPNRLDRLDLVADDVRQRRLDDFARMVLGCPVRNDDRQPSGTAATFSSVRDP